MSSYTIHDIYNMYTSYVYKLVELYNNKEKESSSSRRERGRAGHQAAGGGK